jgi:lipopolysaccharide/colanic/teichoic acid biosynthesis glycosyltransferase
MQRALDILFASMALLMLSPILVPVMIALRLTGEGEVFYCQQRVGRSGVMFGVWKFATMLKISPSLGAGTVTLKNDPRVLPLGKVLRKTKINELPQLFNILNGTMSIIGPRPQTLRCFGAFPATSQVVIKRVRPGLTGIGSIVFRNEEELMHADANPERFYDEVIMPYKGRLEEWYADNSTIGTYLKLIILTALVIFNPRIDVIWTAFPDLPRPSEQLAHMLGLNAHA